MVKLDNTIVDVMSQGMFVIWSHGHNHLDEFIQHPNKQSSNINTYRKGKRESISLL